MHQSFFSYRRYRYAVRAGALAVLAILAYVFCPLREPKSGGTWLGYTLGTIGALLIVYLAWYGVRRRTFGSGGSASGWLSAHVYFGFRADAALATLHCGFQFGWNVHTAAYVLLALVVLSGAWGTYAYARYPSLIVKQRGNISRAELVEEIYQLDGRALRVASVLPADVHDLAGRLDPAHAGWREHLGDAPRVRRIHRADSRGRQQSVACGCRIRASARSSKRSPAASPRRPISNEIAKMHSLLDIVAAQSQSRRPIAKGCSASEPDPVLALSSSAPVFRAAGGPRGPHHRGVFLLVRAMRFRVLRWIRSDVATGNKQYREVVVQTRRLTIGRGSDQHLQIADPKVFENHAVIRPGRGREGAVVVEALTPSGVVVNGRNRLVSIAESRRRSAHRAGGADRRAGAEGRAVHASIPHGRAGERSPRPSARAVAQRFRPQQTVLVADASLGRRGHFSSRPMAAALYQPLRPLLRASCHGAE